MKLEKQKEVLFQMYEATTNDETKWNDETQRHDEVQMNDEAQMLDKTYNNAKSKQYQLKTTNCNEMHEYNTDTTHSNLTREGSVYAMKQVRKSPPEVKMHAVSINSLATNTTNPYNNTNNHANQTAINTLT